MPHHVVVVVVAEPVVATLDGTTVPAVAHVILEVGIALFEHVQILLVAAGLVGVEDNLQGL